MPGPLQEQLQEFLGRLWAAAAEQAEERTRQERAALQAARDGEAHARIAAEAQGSVADELRAQLAAARESFGTGLLERVEALERARETAPPAPHE